DAISRRLLDRNPTDRFGARPTPQAEANAAQNHLLLAREARPGIAIEDGLDGFQGEKLLFAKLSNPAKPLHVLLVIERSISTGLVGRGQEALGEVEMNRLARKAAFADQVPHAEHD